MCRPANGRRFPNSRARTGAAGKPAQSLVFLGCRARPKPAACIPCQDVKTMGPTPRLRLRALGAIVRNYQSPAMVNAELPQANLAAGKRGPAGGWEARRGGPRFPTCRNSRARGPGPAARPRRAAALRPRYQSSGAPGRMKSGARYPWEEPALARKIVPKITTREVLP